MSELNFFKKYSLEKYGDLKVDFTRDGKVHLEGGRVYSDRDIKNDLLKKDQVDLKDYFLLHLTKEFTGGHSNLEEVQPVFCRCFAVTKQQLEEKFDQKLSLQSCMSETKASFACGSCIKDISKFYFKNYRNNSNFEKQSLAPRNCSPYSLLKKVSENFPEIEILDFFDNTLFFKGTLEAELIEQFCFKELEQKIQAICFS